MAINKNTRTKMEKLIYETFEALDPSKLCADKYKNMFKKMSDVEFEKYFKTLFKNEDEYLILDIVDYERTVTIENIEKAAKILDIPLFEKVALPFLSPDTNTPVVTKYEVPVGYIHCKRVQQFLRKKNATSTDIGMRSALSGQVMGKDKNARDSDQENYALVTLGAENILKELMGPRADDPVMKDQMYSHIAKDGYVSLEDLDSDVKNKVTLNTIDVFFMGMGITTDLVTPGLVVKKSLK